MGRAALDEDAIRLIEQHNPDVEFDWTRILKGQGAPDPAPPRRNEQDRRPAGARRPERRARPRLPEGPGAPPIDEPETEDAPEAEALVPESIASFEPEPSPFAEPAAVPEPALDGPVSAAQARLGVEALVRLRARYSEMLARISERVPDPTRQDELKAHAERLNPDTWVTDSDVTAGLEGYEAALEALRAVVGHGRRRRRRGAGGRDASDAHGADTTLDSGSQVEEAAPTEVPNSLPGDDSEPV